jgi:uncharacterized protein
VIRSGSISGESFPLAGVGVRILLLLVLWAGLAGIDAAEVIPPRPARYFNDYAGVVRADTAGTLNRKLEDFERSTSSQILVAIFPKMESNSSVEDYAVRVAQAWAVGQKGKNNGAVLFVFVQEHQLYLQVGYGLEGAIPDATAKTIIEQEIKPRLRAGDFDGGMVAGVNALLQAARGEYQGTGRTVAEQGRSRSGRGIPMLLLVIVLLILIAAARRSQGTVYRRSGRSAWSGWPGGWGGGGWGGGWGSGGGGGGGWSGGSSGGFSSGGGSFGGGGAGGQW